MNMLPIVDRRYNPGGRHLPDEQRFKRRQRDAVKEAARRKLREGSLREMADGGTKRLRTDRQKSTEEPEFHHGAGGAEERVHPGNKRFKRGDRLPKPPSGGGSGNEGSPDGEGEDEFVFEVSQREFLDYLFEDLELPDMVKKIVVGDEDFEFHRAGFTREGPPSKLDYVRSFKNAHARQIAFSSRDRRRVKELEDELREIEDEIQNAASGVDVSSHEQRAEEIRSEIDELNRRIEAVPFLDDYDLRYRRHEKQPVPITQAVMFCILDASASMDEWKKEMAKRFLLLLYLFLRRSYEKVDVVFIRHTQYAKEVGEEEFFYSQETGGTVVSSAYELMDEIVRGRYSLAEWNVYCAQASDGDDWSDDLPIAHRMMEESILPVVQYHAYVEIDQSRRATSQLWETLSALQDSHANLAMARIRDASDIYPVFRDLFKARQEA